MKSSWTVASDLWTLAGVESREKCWAEIIGSFCLAFFLYLPHPTHPPPHFIIIIITVQLRWWKAHNITFSRWVGLLSKDHSGVHKKNNSAQYERKEREKFIIMKTYIFSENGRKGYFDSLFFPRMISQDLKDTPGTTSMCAWFACHYEETWNIFMLFFLIS